MTLHGLVRGDHAVDMRPDVCLWRDDSPALVLNAKWKTGSVSSSDVYQLAACQLANDVPGLIVYRSQEGALTGSSIVQESYPLRLIELPTAADPLLIRILDALPGDGGAVGTTPENAPECIRNIATQHGLEVVIISVSADEIRIALCEPSERSASA